MRGNAACFKSEMQNALGEGAEFFNSYKISGHFMSQSTSQYTQPQLHQPGITTRLLKSDKGEIITVDNLDQFL